jgi:hypothetical protein
MHGTRGRRLVALLSAITFTAVLVGVGSPAGSQVGPPDTCAAWPHGPIHIGSPFYAPGLDQDGDGVACESNAGPPSTATDPTPWIVTYADIDYTPSENGYWLLKSDGAVETRGAAPSPGGPRGRGPGERFTALIPTASGNGYWLTTNLGRVIAVGDAFDVTDLVELLGAGALQGEIVGAANTPSGKGFWLVGADGGVFALGDARFLGSIPGLQRPGGPLAGRQLAAPITGLAGSPSGRGYWMVAEDGGMFSFGDAGFFGSIPGVLAPGQVLDAPVTDMIPQGSGYLILAIDGGIFNFGQSQFHGSLGGHGLRDIVAATVKANRSGYLILRSNGTVHGFGTSTLL